MATSCRYLVCLWVAAAVLDRPCQRAAAQSVPNDASVEGAGHQYCIIGAGPAGVQLGHFFKHAGRDYVIFERNHSAGSFFAKFPRHRMLISLNKRFVREGHSADFAFRHDWNSLIDLRSESNRTSPVTERSKLLFPKADTLKQYIEEFAEEQRDAIQYGVEVTLVQRAPDGIGFELTLERSISGNSEQVLVEMVRCREVIAATGFWRPRGVKGRVDGAEFVQGYEDLPATGESFEGKSVIVLGLGNAALETVQELQKYTAEAHIFAREREVPQGGRGVRFAYQTHYVGDIRAGRTTILDTYLLKSLDSFDFTALEGIRRLVLIPCQGTRLCVWSVEEVECADERCKEEFRKGGQNLNYWLPIAKWLKGGRMDQHVKDIMVRHMPNEGPETGYRLRSFFLKPEPSDLNAEERALSTEELQQRRAHMGINESVFQDEYQEVQVMADRLRSNPVLMDELVPLRNAGSDNVRHPMDHVIRCFGWALDQSIFDKKLGLNTTHKGKYPEITPLYEAVGVPGLYFAGTLGHGLDFRRSAGGFVHGFRYTARALFRYLEEKNFGVPWPHQRFSLDLQAGFSSGLTELAGLLQDRINGASGPYQMFQTLGDMVVFERDEALGRWFAVFLEEVPLRHFDERYRHLPRLVWFFKYGDRLYGPQVLGSSRVGSTNPWTAEKSAFLHPQLSYFPANAENATMRHWLVEDIYTKWVSADNYAPLARFLGLVAAEATGNPDYGSNSSVQLERLTEELSEVCPLAAPLVDG